MTLDSRVCREEAGIHCTPCLNLSAVTETTVILIVLKLDQALCVGCPKPGTKLCGYHYASHLCSCHYASHPYSVVAAMPHTETVANLLDTIIPEQ